MKEKNNYLSSEDYRDKEWYEFYFRKNWKSIFTTLLFLILAYDGLHFTWNGLKMLIYYFKASPFGMGILIFLGIGLMLAFLPAWIAWAGIGWIADFYQNKKIDNAWEKNIKGGLIILGVVFAPGIIFYIIDWILWKLV